MVFPQCLLDQFFLSGSGHLLFDLGLVSHITLLCCQPLEISSGLVGFALCRFAFVIKIWSCL